VKASGRENLLFVGGGFGGPNTPNIGEGEDCGRGAWLFLTRKKAPVPEKGNNQRGEAALCEKKRGRWKGGPSYIQGEELF